MKHPLPGRGIARLGAVLALASCAAHAELRGLDDAAMSGISGRDGITLNGHLNLAAAPADSRCAGGCGARLAFQPTNSSGFIVIDNVKGTFGFDNTTLDIVTIDSGFNGDGKLFSRQAMKVGLASFSVDDLQFTLGGANQGKLTGSGLQQTNLLTYQASGTVRLTGNLYLFGQP